MAEIRDYLAEIDTFQPLGIAKYGYTVELELYSTGGGFRIYLSFTEKGQPAEHIATLSVSLVDSDYKNKTWDVLNAEIHERVLAEYDKHNQNFTRGELLKALENRLNSDAEMLVLTPGFPATEDKPDTHTWLGSFR